MCLRRDSRVRRPPERAIDAAGRALPCGPGGDDTMNIDDLLRTAVERGASKLHLKVGSYPMMRVRGELVRGVEDRRLSHEEPVKWRARVMSTVAATKVQGTLSERGPRLHRRGPRPVPVQRLPAARHDRAGPARHPDRGLSIDELRLPPVLRTIAEEERGLVLVTGTTASGKSTTLAAMIEHINTMRCATWSPSKTRLSSSTGINRSIVNQREVSVDTQSFAHALRSALRQDPDVILVGEMRDLETIDTALLAAETGHLVFSTLHTLDATETINRLIAVYPPHQQRRCACSWPACSRPIISQRLMPRLDATSRVPAVEVLVTTAFIRDCIIDKERTHLIRAPLRPGTSAVRHADLRPVDLRPACSRG